ncbi:hypothetical protein WI88_32940 [Burkholderia ubonensis]|nr:hypothetical protein WI88_32940 [Burkholderia ubonensis]
MRFLLPTMQATPNFPDHVRFVGRAALAERVGFHVLIQQLIWVQLGTITRQPNQAQAISVLGDELLDSNGPVDRMTNDDQIDLPDSLLEQVLQEFNEPRVLERAAEDNEVGSPRLVMTERYCN